MLSIVIHMINMITTNNINVGHIEETLQLQDKNPKINRMNAKTFSGWGEDRIQIILKYLTSTAQWITDWYETTNENVCWTHWNLLKFTSRTLDSNSWLWRWPIVNIANHGHVDSLIILWLHRAISRRTEIYFTSALSQILTLHTWLIIWEKY